MRLQNYKDEFKHKLGHLLDEKYYNKFDPPEKFDWQYIMREKHQSIYKYISGKITTINKTRNKIYIQPLIYNKKLQDYELLLEYITIFFQLEAIFFQLEAILLDPINIDTITSKKRIIENINQYSAIEIRKVLQKLLPSDAFCLIALTDVDLYSTGYNFVFGEASYDDRVGVLSYLRFDKIFMDKLIVKDLSTIKRKINTENNKKKEKLIELLGLCKRELKLNGKLINRLLKLITHEILHMFSIEYCIKYNCNMC